MDNTKVNNDHNNDRPPIFQTWNQLYVFVIIMHAIIITLFYLFTEHHS